MLPHVLAGGALVEVAVAYAWPLVEQLTTAMPGGPGDQDVATMVWNVGWVHQALATDGLSRSLLRTTDVLVPREVVDEIVASDGFVGGWAVVLR